MIVSMPTTARPAAAATTTAFEIYAQRTGDVTRRQRAPRSPSLDGAWLAGAASDGR